MDNALSESTTRHRSFFALWPDQQVRDRLLALAEERVTEGRPTPPQNLHMTLAFLGDISDEETAELLSLAGTVVFKPFEIMIDRLGYFTRPQILWAGPSEVPGELCHLHGMLSQRITSCLPEWRGENFTPHVTLARKAPKVTVQKIAPLLWTLDHFCLVRSQQDGKASRYEVLQRFPATANQSLE